MKTKIINYVSFAFSGLLVLTTLYLMLILLIPVDILKNWRITTENKIYHPGSRVVLEVEYEKIRESAATTYYSLECKRINGSHRTYSLFQVEAKKAKSKGTVKVPVDLPRIILDLPTECRISVKAYYHVFSIRDVLEENVSNYFTVKEAE